MGRPAKGVKGIQLRKEDKVIFAEQVDDEGELVVITDRGFAKRTLLADYEKQNRGGKGFRTITFPRDNYNGKMLVNAFYIKEPYELILLQKDGTTTRLDPDELEIQTRAAHGQSVVLVIMDNELISAYRNYN
jgi:DNA gyrase/topoisomerase IV subunit A